MYTIDKFAVYVDDESEFMSFQKLLLGQGMFLRGYENEPLFKCTPYNNNTSSKNPYCLFIFHHNQCFDVVSFNDKYLLYSSAKSFCKQYGKKLVEFVYLKDYINTKTKLQKSLNYVHEAHIRAMDKRIINKHDKNCIVEKYDVESNSFEDDDMVINFKKLINVSQSLDNDTIVIYDKTWSYTAQDIYEDDDIIVITDIAPLECISL